MTNLSCILYDKHYLKFSVPTFSFRRNLKTIKSDSYGLESKVRTGLAMTKL